MSNSRLDALLTIAHPLFQNCMTYILLWNIKADVLKNVGNQDKLIEITFLFKNTFETFLKKIKFLGEPSAVKYLCNAAA